MGKPRSQGFSRRKLKDPSHAPLGKSPGARLGGSGCGKVRTGAGEKLEITAGTKEDKQIIERNKDRRPKIWLESCSLFQISLVRPFLYFTRLTKRSFSLPLSHGNICGHCVNYSSLKE